MKLVKFPEKHESGRLVIVFGLVARTIEIHGTANSEELALASVVLSRMAVDALEPEVVEG